MRTWHVLWSVYKFLCSFTKKWNVFCKSLVTILFCYQETTSLLKRLTTLDDLQIGPNFSETNDLEEPVSITGLETFTLGYKVCSFLVPISSFCLLLYICTFAALLIMNLLEFLCLLIVFSEYHWIHELTSFCGFQVRWPLSLVISRKALTRYQLIFRFLFHCKHVNRQLCAAWQVHQVCSLQSLAWLPSNNSFRQLWFLMWMHLLL